MDTSVYKICPECQTPAEVTAGSCGKCGHIYRSQYVAPPPGQPQAGWTGGATGIPPYASPSARQSNTALWVALAVLGGLALCALIVVAAVMNAPTMTPRVPQTTADGGAAAPGGSLLARGMFTERPSAVEMPTVRVSNMDDDIMTLTFTGADGRQYSLRASAGQPGSVQLPAGDYRVYLTSNDPTINDNHGTAVFRRYKEYEASFSVVDYEVPPIRMGDE